jgi:hypothetical protein
MSDVCSPLPPTHKDLCLTVTHINKMTSHILYVINTYAAGTWNGNTYAHGGAAAEGVAAVGHGQRATGSRAASDGHPS